MNKPKAEIMKIMNEIHKNGERTQTPKVRNTGLSVCSSDYQSRGSLKSKHKGLFFSVPHKIFENVDETDNFLE